MGPLPLVLGVASVIIVVPWDSYPCTCGGTCIHTMRCIQCIFITREIRKWRLSAADPYMKG